MTDKKVHNSESYSISDEESKLFRDAQEMLNHALEKNWLEVEAVYGIWEANTIEDDIFIFDEDGNRVRS